MKKRFFWFGAMILVAIAGYFLLSQENVSSFTIPYIKIRTKDIIEKTGRVTLPLGQSAKNLIVSGATQASSFAVHKSGEAISGIIGEIKTGTFRLLKETADKGMADLGADSGISASGANQIATIDSDSPIIFTIKTDSPANFAIKNRKEESVLYEIDWQDGNTEKGAISGGKSINVSHNWKTAGVYSLKFKIFNSKSEKVYQIFISVI